MGSIELIKASDGSGNASSPEIQNSRLPGATTIIVNTVLGINPNGFAGSMGTPHTFIDPITSEEITVISEDTCIDFIGHVDGVNLEIDDIAPGYVDNGSEVNDIVVIRPTTQYADNLAEVLEVAHEDDGTVKIGQGTPVGVIQEYAGTSAPAGFLLCDGSAVDRDDYADLFDVIGTTYGAGDGSTTFNIPDRRGRGGIGVGTGQFTFTFASTDVNTSNEQIAVAANPELITGRRVQLTTTGTLPTGLSLATDYYIIVVDSTHIQLASSRANAVAGTAINLTGAGSGTNTATGTLTARTLGQHGGEEQHSLVTGELPAHTHGLSGRSGSSALDHSANSNNIARSTSASGSTSDTNTNSTGSSEAHNVMAPWLALNYIIKT